MKTCQGVPVDHGGLVGVIFFILGTGTLLPWNFFMTATEYFNNRLNTSEVNNGTVGYHQKYFNNLMTLLSQLPLLLFTFLNSFLYQRLSEKVRISGSLLCILFLFILTTILVMVDMNTDSFFSITMATIWFINSFGAVLQGSLFGLVGLLPQKYSAIFMSGQGMAGTFAALAMIVTIYTKVNERSAALWYFITPCVGTLITLLGYMFLPRLEFAQYYFGKGKTCDMESKSVLLMKITAIDDKPVGKSQLNGYANGSVPEANGSAAHANGKGDVAKQWSKADEGQHEKLSVLQVLRKIWVMAFCVTFVFMVTLSVFPVVTVDVQTIYPGKWEQYFIPVCCFLTFNVMDWIGRSVGSVLHWPSKESRLFPALVVARVIFIPLLMLCNVKSHSYLPVVFWDDCIFTFIMALFSVTSGYLACLSMSYAPQLVESKDAETAGALMTFFLALGLSLGAALSFPLRAFV